MGGGSETTTTTTANPPSPEQTALTERQIALADEQLASIRASKPLTDALLAGATEMLPLQIDFLKKSLADIDDPEQKALRSEQTAFARESIPIQRELQQKALEIIRRGGAASPEEMELIKRATEAGITAGESDIDRATGDAFDQLRDFATQSGLRTSDSPILDRGNRVVREGVRGKTDLATRLRGAQATAELNFPLARDQLISGITTAQQGIAGAAQAFQAQLRDAALSARMRFSSGLNESIFGGTSAGFSQAGAAGSGISSLAAAISPLNASRGTTSTAERSNSPGFLDFITAGTKLAGGIGSFF